MKIYTKTGDDGSTGLIGGARVPKSDLSIQCLGSIDELNAGIGWAAVVAPPALLGLLRPVQNELFVIGSHLASPPGKRAAHLPPLVPGLSHRLEAEIDAAESRLPPLQQFILPGGGEPAARLHLARAVCRRAERHVVELAHHQPVSEVTLTYLNRLSDWLFVHARAANAADGIADVPWEKS